MVEIKGYSIEPGAYQKEIQQMITVYRRKASQFICKDKALAIAAKLPPRFKPKVVKSVQTGRFDDRTVSYIIRMLVPSHRTEVNQPLSVYFNGV